MVSEMPKNYLIELNYLTYILCCFNNYNRMINQSRIDFNQLHVGVEEDVINRDYEEVFVCESATTPYPR